MRFLFQRRGVLVVPGIAMLLSGQVFAEGGNPRLFEKSAGNYSAEGISRTRSPFGAVTSKTSATGSLEMKDSPRSAVLTLNGEAVSPSGVTTSVTWTLDFRRKGACTVRAVYGNGITVTTTGQYERTKRRVKISGSSSLSGGPVTRFGDSVGRLRLSVGGLRKYAQKDTFPDQELKVRQILTKS